MSVALDRPVRVGATVVAALSRVRVASHGAGRGAVFYCDKAAVAILCAQGGAIGAIGMDGTRLTAEAIERLCPGALDEFAGMAASFME